MKKSPSTPTKSSKSIPPKKRTVGSHFRQGHYRQYKNKKIWINGTIVKKKEYFNTQVENATKYYNRVNKALLKVRTLFDWPGGKKDFFSRVQFIWLVMINHLKIQRLIIPFIGSGADFTNLAPKLIGKIDTIVINDINPSIVNIYRQMRDCKALLIQEVKNIINTSIQTKEELKIYVETLMEEINALEKQRIYTARTAALFLVIQNMSFSGNYRWNGDHSKFSKAYDVKKAQRLTNVLDKIELYTFFMSQFKNFIIEEMDYAELLAKYDAPDGSSLIVADPPYVKRSKEINLSKNGVNISKDDINLPLNKTDVDYGIVGFDHEKCTDFFINNIHGSLIYHNYFNQSLVARFEQNKQLDHMIFEKSINNTSKAVKDKCLEVIYFTNKHYSQTNPNLQLSIKSNNIDFRPSIQPSLMLKESV